MNGPYDTTEVGARYKVHPHTIRDWINRGCPSKGKKVKLTASRVGRKWMIREEDLAVFEMRLRPLGGGPELDLDDAVPS
jgi:transposase